MTGKIAAFVGACVIAFALIGLVWGISTLFWKLMLWPWFFENWLGPITWEAAAGIAFLWATINYNPPASK